MRIALILIIGIIAYLIVFIPGYFFIVPDETIELSDNKTSAKLKANSNTKKSPEKQLSNPGDAPPPKWIFTFGIPHFGTLNERVIIYY